VILVDRRKFLKVAGFGAASFMFSGCGRLLSSAGKNSESRPNIVFIMTDDHTVQAMSCYGSKINKTPNLDRIAAGGMRFENCFCTNSICAPSRAVILTGKYSHVNGVIDNIVRFDAGQQTFPKILREHGYETAMVGKWHLKSEPTGFDYYNILPGQGEYYDPVLIEMGTPKKHKGYVTDIITDYCLGWLKGRSGEKPFCLMYQHKAPHRNWQPDEKHAGMYDDVEIPEPETFNDDYSTRSAAAHEQEMTIEHHLTPGDLKVLPPADWKGSREQWNNIGVKGEPWPAPNDLKGQALKKWKYQRYIKDYLRCVASVDDNVGRLLDYLDESGLADTTIVVYTSDQGFYLGEHGWFDKRFMYEESLRMPFLVRYPKEVKAGSVNSDIAVNIDFAPTFLDFAGIGKPSDMQGESLRPLLEGRTPTDWRQSMYYHYYEYPGWHAVKRHYGVRTKRYKLIHFYHDIDAWELYDLEKDPHELDNVYGNPAYKHVAEDLERELRRLQKKYGDSDELARQMMRSHPAGDGA
jgi:arylsulfatase A-like enzyme